MNNKKRFQTIAERRQLAKRIMTLFTLCLTAATLVQAKCIFNLFLLWLHRPEGISFEIIFVDLFLLALFIAEYGWFWWVRNNVIRKRLIAWMNTAPEDAEAMNTQPQAVL